MVKGYERAYEIAVEKLDGFDLVGEAQRLKLQVTPQSNARVNFLGNRYEIGSNGVVCLTDASPNFVERALLIHFITSGGKARPTGEFWLPGQFVSESEKTVAATNISWQNRSLEEKFSEDAQAVYRALSILSAVEIPQNEEGRRIWQMELLPNIVCQVICYEADDEFPLTTHIRFDKSAKDYFEFESIAFLHSAVVHALVNL
ncbi:MAG: DUF3786 domain-containing protein [Coriobacteriales bacterium]|jgi:hypothetical protein